MSWRFPYFCKSFVGYPAKSFVHRLGVGKLKFVPTDLSKVTHVVNNSVIEKVKCNELIKNVITVYLEKWSLENKIEDIDKELPATSIAW